MKPIEARAAKPGANNRTKVGNGTYAFLTGNGQSREARRIKELRNDFADEAGGYDKLPASGQQIVRTLARTSFELELLEAERVAGRPIDPLTFVTLVNSQRRLLAQLHSIKPKSAPTPTLTDHLSRTYGQGAE